MRRIVFGLVLLVGAAPFIGAASDVQDGRACRNASQSDVRTFANGASEEDRFSVCVKAGGVTAVYAGGEAQSEDSRNDGFMGTCGAVIVADQHVASGNYGEDWDRSSYPQGHPRRSNFHC